MTEHVCKVLVAGGGPAGLTAAALLAQNGIDTICLAPPAERPDPRTVALMAPSITLLKNIGVWQDDVTAASEPLRQLHVIDDTGNLVQAPPVRFSAREMNLDCFGWNIPLAVLIPALRRRAEESGARLMEHKVTGAEDIGQHLLVNLDTGDRVTCVAAIAADGAQSKLRAAAGIAVEQWSFEQDAMVTNFNHTAPHEGVSTEWHKLGGPFTTVPLPGNRSALVWMNRPAEIARLMALPLKDLAREIQLAGHGSLGAVSEVTPPARFAMRGVRASRYAGKRTYLVGEAAHVFPPVGAQGLNMSLRDIGHAVDVITGADDAGAPSAMAEYDGLRKPDVLARQMAISAVNTSLLSSFLPMHLLRSASLFAVGAIPPLRALAMREGLAPSHGLPFSMRAAG